MGHIRLGALPRTYRWSQVVGFIRTGANVDVIAAGALHAADAGLRSAVDDAGVGWATWLLTQLPLAACDPNYVERLRVLGIAVTEAPSALELVSGFIKAIDAHVQRTGRRTDLGEMAQMAAAETLTQHLGQRTGALFGTAAAEVQRTLAASATPFQFGAFARDFFANLTRRYLTFFLSRELSNHVGGARRFANTEEHAAFNKALALHCRQASVIVEEFAGRWFSKTHWERGIGPPEARAFAWVALKKIRAELHKRAEAAA